MRHLTWFGAALLLALALAWFGARTPAPRPADAPPAQFSAGRAMADVEVIGRAPHPTGSAENARVRAHVLSRMGELGLEVSVQRASAVVDLGAGGARGAWVQNLIGVLPGRDRGLPPVLLMSHYDSAPGSPGAADDAAGVAASLETARALAADGPPERDVVVLVTDAEERGLLGAQAFFQEHPLAGRIGAVVNLEARGSAGRAFMFETGPDNGAAADLYRRVAPRPASTSLAVFMYRLMPNDTDFTHARRAGLQGYNLAFIGELFHYHAASSTPAALDQGSLQHIGEQALALTRALAGPEGPPPARPNAVYADLFGRFVIAYPAAAGWIPLGLSGLLALGVLLLARRREGGGWGAPARGAAAALGLLLLAAAAAWLARLAVGVAFGFLAARPLMARAEAFEAALALIGLGLVLGVAAGAARGGVWRWIGVAAGLAVALAAQLLAFPDLIGAVAGLLAAALLAFALARPAPGASGAAGALGLAWLLGLAAQLAAPEAAIAIHWPLLAAAAAAFAALRWPGRAGAAVAVIAGGVGAGFILLLAHSLYLGVGLDLPWALSLPLLLAALCLWPLLARAAGGPAGPPAALVALAAGAAVVAWLATGPAPTRDRPATSHVQYLAEPETGRFARITLLAEPDVWTRAALADGGGRLVRHDEPALFLEGGWAAEAAPVPAIAAPLGVERLADGRAVLRVPPGYSPTDLLLTLDPGQGALSDLVLNGQALAAPPAGRPLRIRWSDPSGGVELVFRPPAGAATEILWAAIHDGWPAAAPPLPPRPDTIMPWGTSDSLAVVGRRQLAPAAAPAPHPGRSPPP